MIRKFFQLLPVVGALLLLLSSCSATISGPGAYGGSTSGGTSGGSTGGNTSPSTPSGATPNWGVQTKTSGCHVNGPLQDPACTPGDIIKTATKAEICAPGYAGKVRNVPQSVKNLAYSSYGILSHKTGTYEVDHLVSLEIGGSNDISNLWPEIATPKPGFHEKDKVENYLHAQLCKGAMTLNQVQVAIATNWLAIYNSMPASSKSGTGSSTGSA
jgi:hypothetical protein